MENNEIFFRIQCKHDTEANWLLVPEFVPLDAEIIVYDKDDKYLYSRFKIGDGKTKISELPFSPAETAIKLATARKISLTGALTGEVLFDGSKDVSIETDLNVDFNLSGLNHNHSFSGSQSTGSTEYTPKGVVNISYVPKGNISKPAVTVTENKSKINVITGITDPTFIPGSVTFQSLSTNLEEKTLHISLTDGSYTAPQFMNGAISQQEVSILTSVSVDASAPTFTGTEETLSGQLTGTKETISISITPNGTIEEKNLNNSGTISYTLKI